MCRAKDETGVRCLRHSAEGKAETRAAEKLQNVGDGWLEALKQRVAELGTAQTEQDSGIVLSRWRQILSDVMLAWDQTRTRLAEKRSEMTKRRAAHYAEKVAAVKNEEKRQAAEEAVRRAEAAQLELEVAEDAYEEARSMEIRTRPLEGFCTPKAVAEWDHSIARAEADDARTLRDAAWAKLKPMDDKPDPKTGTPTRRRLAYQAAQRLCESTARIETYLEGVARNIPDHGTSVADLGRRRLAWIRRRWRSRRPRQPGIHPFPWAGLRLQPPRVRPPRRLPEPVRIKEDGGPERFAVFSFGD